MDQQTLIKLYDEAQAAQQKLNAALAEFVAENAEYDIGQKGKQFGGSPFLIQKRSARFDDNRSKAYLESHRFLTVSISYEGKKLKQNGEAHATAGAYGYQHIALTSTVSA